MKTLNFVISYYRDCYDCTSPKTRINGKKFYANGGGYDKVSSLLAQIINYFYSYELNALKEIKKKPYGLFVIGDKCFINSNGIGSKSIEDILRLLGLSISFELEKSRKTFKPIFVTIKEATK